MKSYTYFLIFSSMVVMHTTSCEQTELRRTENAPVPVVEARSIEDCEECPEEDCCCTVIAIPIPPEITIPLVTLTFCGTTTPGSSSVCSENNLGSCSDIINGETEVISLSNLSRRMLFCSSAGNTFGISSYTIDPNVMIAITCQTGNTAPQTVYYTLSGTGSRPYWRLNIDCELESCF